MSKIFEKDVVVIDLRSTKEKAKDLKCKAKEKAQDGVEWCKRNKDWLIPVLPIAIGVAGKLINGAVRRRNLCKAERLKEEYCYDRSLGHYWALKRKLTNKEWLAIEERRKKGERLADILADLKVLK